MKKLLIVLAIVLAFSVVFVACNSNDAETPTTEAPTTAGNDEAPTTGAPTTDEPTSDEPTSDEPTSDEPTSDEPTSDEPTSDEPTSDEPTSDEPTSDEPTSDEPTSDEPTSDEPTSDEPTSDEPTSDEPTTEPVEEVIGFIGALSDINGLGPNGKKFSATNSYIQYTPHTTNPVTYYPPTVGDAWDYTCRRFSVNGWAIVDGGINGDLIWSDDMGLTWKKVDEVSYSDQAVDLTPFGNVAGFMTPASNWDANFTATIDLSGYADDEYVTIWIGRETGDGKPVAIFKFSDILIGDELYVAETHEECDHVSMDDMQNPVYIVSFDVCKSSHNLTDAAGRTDRLRVWNHDNIVGDSIGNNTPHHTWNKVLRILQKDVEVADHVFTIEGWAAFTKEGMNHTNVTFGAEVYRNGELLKTAGGTSVDVAANVGVVGVINGNANLKGGSLYKLWLGVSDLQAGDNVHVFMKHTAADGTETTYCIKDFTIEIVANDTDLTCTDKM